MKKNLFVLVSLLFGAVLAILRYLQFQSGFDPETRLFSQDNPYGPWVVGVALFAGVLFFALSRLGPAKRPERHVKAGKFTRFSGEVFLQCAIITALGRLFLLFSGQVTTPVDILLVLFAVALPIYCVGLMVYFYKDKERGLSYLGLIPVVGLMLYLIFAYVSITEMASFQIYVLHILSGCSLLVFFFGAARSALYETTGRGAACAGYLAAAYVMAESVPYPVYSLIHGLGDITITSVATSWLMGWGLVVFLLGYSRQLQQN